MVSSRNRALAIIALLVRYPWGLSAHAIATNLDIPTVATHRLIAGLIESGYLHPVDPDGRVRLSIKLPALGLAYLGVSGITDVVQPILDDLAKRAGELVRLGIVDADRVTWVAKSQGARTGLLYDPEVDAEAVLPTTANGQAWLSCLDETQVRSLIARLGDRALTRPQRLDMLMRDIVAVRERGYAIVSRDAKIGTSAIAAPVRRPGSEEPIGTVSIAGPTVRLSPERISYLAPMLLASTEEVGAAAIGSPLFKGGSSQVLRRPRSQ
jgi:IclR family transcriptional regulator, acetate operon repressor